MIRVFLFCLVLNFSLFAHGVFYKVMEGAISVRITAPNNIAISDAKVSIYAPGGSLAFTKGKTDINGNFAFLPDSKGKWKVLVDVPSDHGSHKKEFTVDINENFKLQDYDKEPFERYFAILSALGILFGIFGLYSIYLRRKDTSK